MSQSPSGRGDILWEEFKRLLCKLYESYGGDCSELDWGDDGETAVAQVQTEFDTNGLPVFSSPAEEQEFRDLLDDLEQNIGHSSTPPSAAAKAAAQSLINNMRAALPT